MDESRPSGVGQVPAGGSWDLTGRTALVTGGASGIGRSICLVLADRGAAVVVADLDASAADGVSHELSGQGAASMSTAVDVRQPEACAQAVAVAAAWQGGPDILVNCAGVYPTVSMLDVSEEHWDLVLDTNLKGTFFMTQAFARHLVTQARGGCVVNISSRTGIRASGRLPAYSASKAGVISLTQSAAQELGPRGIRVNAVAPGPIVPPGAPGSRPTPGPSGPAGEDRTARIPLGRFGTGWEVAEGVAFLVSGAASLVTGAVLAMDGGSLLP